jgi:hypothetical protein
MVPNFRARSESQLSTRILSEAHWDKEKELLEAALRRARA